jgi:hypothetical protein
MPTEAQASEFSGLINQETGEMAGGTGQSMQGQTDGEEGSLSPEELSAIAGMIAGVMTNSTAETSLIPTNPEGPTGSLLAPAALGGIPALSYALTMGGEEMNAIGGAPTSGAITQGLPLLEASGTPAMEALSGALGKQLSGEQVQIKQQASSNKSAVATLNALKSSVSTDSLMAAANTAVDANTGVAIEALGQGMGAASTMAASEQFLQPHQALQSALDAHLSAQNSRNIDNPNWGGNARPQIPRGAMATHHGQSNMATENVLGELPQMASQVNRELSQAKVSWADGNQASQARLNTAERLADIKTTKSEGEIPDLPLAARIIQRSHYAHNMTRPNQSTKVEIDPALTVDGADTSISKNPDMAISEIYEDAANEAAEMMTPEGIVRAPTNMQIDLDGDLSVEIEAIGNEVHVTLDGTKSALDDMKGVRAEIADSLEDGEMNLGEFSTNTRDDEQNESKSTNSRGSTQGEAANDSGATNSKIANQTIVQHGSSVSAVA